MRSWLTRLAEMWRGDQAVELVRREAALSELLARAETRRSVLEAAGDLSRDGLIACDDRLRLAYCNRAAADLLGIAPVEATPDGSWPNGLGLVRAALGRALLGREARLRIPRLLRGRRVEIECIARPVTDAEGGLVGAALSVRDPFGAEAAEAAARTLVREAATPLVSAAGLASLLSQEAAGPLNGVQRDLARTVQSEAQRALATLQRLLGETSWGEPLAVGERGPCDLGRVLVEAAERFTPVAAPRGVQLRLRVVNPLRQAPASRDRLERIVAHLLDNAIAFSPTGGTVEVYAAEVDGGLRLSVTDEGPGIPLEERERVFQRSYRGPNQPAGRSGVGMGLNTCRRIVEEQGGRIWADQAPSGGAALHVVLPLPTRGGTGLALAALA